MTDFDHPWKEAIDLYFYPFLELLFPEVYADVDLSRGFEFLDKELMQILPQGELGVGVVDKLVKVWLREGTESWLLLHIEVQAQEASNFPVRMLVYNNRIFDCYNREVVSLAVLGDDRTSWRPSLYRWQRWGCRKEFEFPIVKLLDFTERSQELATSANPISTIILAHLAALQTRKDPAQRRSQKFALVRSLFERGLAADSVRQLFRLIDWFMQLPVELERAFKDDLQQLEEEKRMPYITSIERMGIEKGRAEGREEGREEGLLSSLKMGLQRRFGDEGIALYSEVQKIPEHAVLTGILAALFDGRPLPYIKNLVAAGQKPTNGTKQP